MIIYLPNSINIFSFLINITLKGTLILLLAFLLIKIFHKLRPRQKSSIIFFAILSFIFIPLCSFLINFINYEIISVLNNEKEIITQSVEKFSVIQNGLIEIPNQITLHNFINTEGIRNKGIDWSSLFLIIWIAGFIVTFYNFLIGKILFYLFNRKTHKREDKKVLTCMNKLKKKMNIKRKVILSLTNSIYIPVTFSFLFPVILLPGEALKWNKNKIKTILIHELNHIKNNDFLTRDVARIICCFFWFLPIVWLAFYIMREEQEKSCDESVLNYGFKSSYYAEQLLILAKTNYTKPLITAITNPIVGTSKLENRILNILNYNPISNFKITTLKFFILLGFFLFFLTIFIIFNFFKIETNNKLFDRIRSSYEINKPTSINLLPINIQNNLKNFPVLWPLVNGRGEVKHINKDNPADGIILLLNNQSVESGVVVSVADGIIESVEYETRMRRITSDIATSDPDNYTIKIKHKDGYSSVYSNISLFKRLKVNQKVYQGEAIGNLYSLWPPDMPENRSSFKFKLKKYNKNIDPVPYLKYFHYHIFVTNNY